MPLKLYVIERDIIGVGALSPKELSDVSATWNGAIAQAGAGVLWSHTYVAGDKTCCIYYADSEQTILEHSMISGFPVGTITEVQTVIDPTTAAKETRTRRLK
jgi:Nickel responsive protein SCO4226-like